MGKTKFTDASKKKQEGDERAIATSLLNICIIIPSMKFTVITKCNIFPRNIYRKEKINKKKDLSYHNMPKL